MGLRCSYSCRFLTVYASLVVAFFSSAKTRSFRHTISCSRMEVDNAWPWNILCTVEKHFNLLSSIITQNYRIWASKNPLQMQQLPIHSAKVTMLCRFSKHLSLALSFSRLLFLRVLSPVQSKGHFMNLFCTTNTFQHCNSVSVSIACVLFLRTLQHQYSSF